MDVVFVDFSIKSFYKKNVYNIIQYYKLINKPIDCVVAQLPKYV